MLFYEAILITTLALMAWFTFKGREPFPLFLPFMVMVVVVEIWLADWYYTKYGNLYPIINPYAKVCLYYYLFVFYQYFKNRPWSGWLRFGILGFVIITLIWNFGFHDHSKIDYLSYNVGFLILFPLMFRYLYEVIYLRPFYNVFHDPYLYFIFGLLLFYTSSFPILGFINILITDNTQYHVYSELLNIGNIFLSLAYLGSALCSRPRTRSTRLS